MARFNLTFRDIPVEELETRLTNMIRNDLHVTADYVRFAILTTSNPNILAHTSLIDYERNKDDLESLGIRFLKEHGVIKRRNLTPVK